MKADLVGSDHVRVIARGLDGASFKAIAFRAMGTELGELLLNEKQLAVHVAGRLTIDDWSGARVPSLHIEDAARVS